MEPTMQYMWMLLVDVHKLALKMQLIELEAAMREMHDLDEWNNIMPDDLLWVEWMIDIESHNNH